MSGKIAPIIFVNYVHKPQGVDKSAALISLIKEKYNVAVTTIVNFSGKEYAAPDSYLFDPLKEVSDKYIDVSNPDRFYFLRHLNRMVILVRTVFFLLQVTNSRNLNNKALILLGIYNGFGGGIGWISRKLVKSRGGLILGYLKSLHDQGVGLTSLSKNSINSKHPGIFNQIDILCVPAHNEFSDMLKTKGLGNHSQLVTGYPICFSSWKKLCQGLAKKRLDNFDGLTVVVFTRGEVKHKQPSEQIVSEDWVTSALSDILAEVNLLTSSNFRLLIKPHPYQNRCVIEAFASQFEMVSVVDYTPSVLSSVSDIAIAFYSSAILDSLAQGVPSIEYFVGTPNFLKMHPDGSPFPAFGANKVVSRGELHDAILGCMSSDRHKNRLGTLLGDESAFDYSKFNSLLLKAI